MPRRLLTSLLLAAMAVSGGVHHFTGGDSSGPVLLREIPSFPMSTLSSMTPNGTEHTGQRLNEIYTDLIRLGAGGSGMVSRARSLQDDSTVAVKQSHNLDDYQEMNELEFAKYARECPLDSDECALVPVRRVFTFVDDDDNIRHGMESMYVSGITGPEYISDGRRYDSVKRARETITELTQSLLPLVKTLQRMHSKGFVHGDISLNNIIYDAERDRWTFLDFGLSSREGHLPHKVSTDDARLQYVMRVLFGGSKVIFDDQLGFPRGSVERAWLKWLRRDRPLSKLLRSIAKAESRRK